MISDELWVMSDGLEKVEGERLKVESFRALWKDTNIFFLET